MVESPEEIQFLRNTSMALKKGLICIIQNCYTLIEISTVCKQCNNY